MVARRLGIQIQYVPLPLNRSGFYVPGPPVTIMVNRDQNHERRNWTIAHELGHWTMHRYMRREFANAPGDKSLFEREANAFAAEFLMPTEVVRELAPELSFGGLAAYFGVSLQAMDKRLRELGVECK